MSLWSEIGRFAAFNAVGLITTVVGIPVMALLDAFGVSYFVYTSSNYLVGIVLGFWLNFQFAFGHHGVPLKTALLRYLICFLTLLAVIQGIQYLLIDGAHWPRWTGVGVGMVLYGGVGYVVSRWWVFQGPRSAEQ